MSGKRKPDPYPNWVQNLTCSYSSNQQQLFQKKRRKKKSSKKKSSKKKTYLYVGVDVPRRPRRQRYRCPSPSAAEPSPADLSASATIARRAESHRPQRQRHRRRQRQDKNGNPPGIIRDKEVDHIPHLLKMMIKRTVMWHVLSPAYIPNSCIVNIYDKDDCIPPHIDHHDFLRPFCTVSFWAKCNILFGAKLEVLGPGEFSLLRLYCHSFTVGIFTRTSCENWFIP